jgi:uncharacterized protein (DUF2141 family)
MIKGIIIFLILFISNEAISQKKLTVVIKGINMETKGYLRVGVFKKEGFLDSEKAIDGKIITINSSSTTLTFSLPEGKYSVIVVQDEDKNGKLNTNFIGYPTEPYAFLNNVKGTFGPPDFEDASIFLSETTKVTIIL